MSQDLEAPTNEALGAIAVQLRLPGGDLLEAKSFPAAASLTEVTEAYASGFYHPKIVKLNAIVRPSLAPDLQDRWETFPGEDACPGHNADELPVACEADIEACRQKCQVEGFGGFVVQEGRAYFRARSGLELKQRRLRQADSTAHLHLHLSAVEAMQEMTLAQLSGGIKENVLELPAVLAVNSPVEMTIPEVASLEQSHPEVTDLRVELGEHDDSLQPIVDKFPSLLKLEITMGINIGKAGSPPSFWDPLMRLGGLEKLLISNHHDARLGALNSAVFESLRSWGDRGPTLKVFALTGAMELDPALYQRFVTTNEVLSPDLEEFSVVHWYAHPSPPQINDEIFHTITKRYRRLKVLQVGSCCYSLTDGAFKYLSDNDEGVEAGLELEKLCLACVTEVNGDKWLEPASVKRCLPKWKQFKIGAGRVFCSCGQPGCGSRADVVRRLRDECGVAFDQGGPHF